jgi:DNA-binding LytR/AlgR family response regulator
LEDILNPQDFFRVSRKYIAKIGSVSKVVRYFNSRLKLELTPPAQDEIIVSRARVSPFLGWLEK